MGTVEVRKLWLICKLRLPYSRRQFDDTLRRVLTDVLQYINQVCIWLDVLQLAGCQPTLEVSRQGTMGWLRILVNVITDSGSR